MSTQNYLDISNYPQNEKYYGGQSCLKLGVTINGIDYLAKLPGNLKAKNLKNVILSYSNAPACEYIGSHIYASLGIVTHVTTLATYKGKNVVLCKDFLHYGDVLYEFRQIKATYPDGFMSLDGGILDSNGSDLDEALMVIRNHVAFKKLPDFEDHFWKMFIVDAIIGNGDRNNGNFGIVRDKDGSYIAPVYDNGNCLNPTWDDVKMERALLAKDNSEIYAGKTCFFTRDDKKINPFQIISSGEFDKCTESLEFVLKYLDLTEVDDIIDSVAYLSEVQNSWYKYIIRARVSYLRSIDPHRGKEMHEYASEHNIDYKDLLGRIYGSMPTLSKHFDDKELCAMEYWETWKGLQL